MRNGLKVGDYVRMRNSYSFYKLVDVPEHGLIKGESMRNGRTTYFCPTVCVKVYPDEHGLFWIRIR